jgi:hypothetical protein
LGTGEVTYLAQPRFPTLQIIPSTKRKLYIDPTPSTGRPNMKRILNIARHRTTAANPENTPQTGKSHFSKYEFISIFQ